MPKPARIIAGIFLAFTFFREKRQKAPFCREKREKIDKKFTSCITIKHDKKLLWLSDLNSPHQEMKVVHD